MGNAPKYKAEDLLINDQFLEWIQSNQQQHDKYWQDRLLNETPLRTAFDQAKEIALTLSSSQKKVDSSIALARLQAQINPPVKIAPQRFWLKAVAAVALLMTLSWVFWPQSQSFQTAYAEMDTIVLPDGTSVTLRANSKLWWNGNWNDKEKRLVHLEGEAYFDVRPMEALKTPRPFVVLADPLVVEVLGTEFDLVNRPTRNHVVLVEGKVSVKGNNQTAYELKPQQRYAWHSDTRQASIENVNPDLYTGWQQHIWRFENTPLSSVAQLLIDHFGKTVIFANPALKNRQLNGSAPSSSLETLLLGIETSLNITVIYDDQRIIFDN